MFSLPAFVPMKHTMYALWKICMILKMMTLCSKVLGSASRKRHQKAVETKNFFCNGTSQGVGTANITMWTSNIHNIGGGFSDFRRV